MRQEIYDVIDAALEQLEEQGNKGVPFDLVISKHRVFIESTLLSDNLYSYEIHEDKTFHKDMMEMESRLQKYFGTSLEIDSYLASFVHLFPSFLSDTHLIEGFLFGVFYVLKYEKNEFLKEEYPTYDFMKDTFGNYLLDVVTYYPEYTDYLSDEEFDKLILSDERLLQQILSSGINYGLHLVYQENMKNVKDSVFQELLDLEIGLDVFECTEFIYESKEYFKTIFPFLRYTGFSFDDLIFPFFNYVLEREEAREQTILLHLIAFLSFRMDLLITPVFQDDYVYAYPFSETSNAYTNLYIDFLNSNFFKEEWEGPYEWIFDYLVLFYRTLEPIFLEKLGDTFHTNVIPVKTKTY